MEAAIQVLIKEGVRRFTTARVAEKAGVSVGSLYQYFPNKAAILFQLQSVEWLQTNAMLRDILRNTNKSPFERLRELVHAFLLSECEEAEMRGALNDAAPLYRDAPEAQEIMAESDRAMAIFMCEALPMQPGETRAIVGDLIMSTLSKVGKEFSETTHTQTEITAYANTMADMFCAYLKTF